MIEFFSENDFQLNQEEELKDWISSIISSEGFVTGDISFVFCNDDYLHSINLEFLNHDTLTDIISFDYSLGKELHGEIYISTERVKDNAKELKVSETDELHRVIIHGVLHLCGHKDKTMEQENSMRNRENASLKARKFI